MATFDHLINEIKEKKEANEDHVKDFLKKNEEELMQKLLVINENNDKEVKKKNNLIELLNY
jgi:mevalonate kinase